MKKGKRKRVKPFGKKAGIKRWKEGEGFCGDGLAQYSRVRGKGHADADEQTGVRTHREKLEYARLIKVRRLKKERMKQRADNA